MYFLTPKCSLYHGWKMWARCRPDRPIRGANKTMDPSVKEVLHLLPKFSMFCALSQNNQQLFEK